MAFRADESASSGFESVKRYLVSRNIEPQERERSENKLSDIVERYGPVVESYPSWHPLVTHHDDQCPATCPAESCGYEGLDHTIYFVNAFITCPYGDGQEVIDSVESLQYKSDVAPYNSDVATITAERLDVQLYQPNATPILVRCDWRKKIATNGMIPASIAVPLMLLKEVPCWEWSTLGETWETMLPYFLGSPHGSRSSLFVNQETGLTIKKVWNLLINTGMFGPIKVSNQY